jgi:hypothetical protein
MFAELWRERRVLILVFCCVLTLLDFGDVSPLMIVLVGVFLSLVGREVVLVVYVVV